ncbi:MAG TPA: hypothetical protein VEQ85_10100, partial [Lacipirellulaceae bacterium]|nr:hypothetical protein [Lacipirellulaceae bacterium]
MVRTAWMVNAALLVGLGLWIWCDPAFMQRWSSGSPYPGTQSPYWLPMSPVRWTILRAGIIAAGVSGSLVLAGLAVGAPRYRGLRAWLLLVTLTPGWLALAVSWQDL